MRRDAQLRIKYALDRVAAGVLLILLSPLFLLVAVLIKLDDRGAVFFRQPRSGRDGEPFVIWKFRTMVQDADRFLDAHGRPTRDRVTRVGRVLRTWSLDELPQLINILRGEMSFIGPRPALVEHTRRYSPEQRERLRVRPGVTGLAQVSGRNRLPWSRRIELDVEYVRRCSLRLDLWILARTLAVVFRREGVVIDRNPDQADDLGAGAEPAPAGTGTMPDAMRGRRPEDEA